MLLLCCTGIAESAQTIKIEVPSVIYAQGDSFTLGQVARITGGNTSTRRTLSALEVFPDGDILTRNEVLRAINNSDASDARVELYMPLRSRIEPPGYDGNLTETPQEQSKQGLVSLIKHLASWDGGLEISVNAPIPAGRVIDPASVVPGSSAITLRFQDDNGRIRPLNVRLVWTQNVMVASRSIKKGDRITAGNLVSRPMKITRPGMYASSPSEIAGFTANRNIKQGEPVPLGSLTSSSVIKRGRQVKILARLGGVRVTADGVLLEEGKPGDWVKVRRADDKRVTLRARIIDENTVEVHVD